MKKSHSLRLLAVAALLTSMFEPVCARADTIYVALSSDATIEKYLTNGTSSVFAYSSLASPRGEAFDSAGNLYVANNFGGASGNGSIEKFTPAGVASVFAMDPGDGSVLSGPEGLAFDSAGNLYVANDGGWIEKFTTNGTPSLFASDPGDGSVLNGPDGLAFDSSGNLYVANTYGGNNGIGSIEKFTTNGTPSLFASDPGDGSVLLIPEGLAFDSSGNLYVANTYGGDNENGSIEKFTTNGTPSLFASDPGDGSVLNNPYDLAFDKTGNLYVVNATGDTNGYGSVEKFKSSSSYSSFISDPGDGSLLNSPVGLAFDGAGNLSVVNSGFSQNVKKFNTNAVVTGIILASLSTPQGLALDSAGNLYVANQDEGTIEEFNTNGVGTLFAATNSPYGLAFDGVGNLYADSSLENTIEKFTTNGTASVFASIGLANPRGLAFDGAGNLYAVNLDATTIEKFDASGTPTVFASTGLNGPFGVALAVDGAGNLYAELNNTIKKFATNGTSLLFASDPGDGSVLSNPQGMAFDSAGNLYVANLDSGTIEEFDTEGNGSVFAIGLNGPTGIVIQRTAPVASLAINNLRVMPRPTARSLRGQPVLMRPRRSNMAPRRRMAVFQR